MQLQHLFEDTTSISDLYHTLNARQLNMLKRAHQNLIGDFASMSDQSQEVLNSLQELNLLNIDNSLTEEGERVLKIASKLGTVDTRTAIKAMRLKDMAPKKVQLDDIEVE